MLGSGGSETLMIHGWTLRSPRLLFIYSRCVTHILSLNTMVNLKALEYAFK